MILLVLGKEKRQSVEVGGGENILEMGQSGEGGTAMRHAAPRPSCTDLMVHHGSAAPCHAPSPP